MATDLLMARHLGKTFISRDGGPATTVLRGVSLAADAGEMVAIVGPSGSGKSTLLYCLSGLEMPTSGEVRLLGRSSAEWGRRGLARLRRGHVGFIFQSYNLIPSLTARENVALPLRLSGVRDDMDFKIDRALEAVGLTDRAGHRPAALSGGQQQRVAIARVLAVQPELVFADEPTGALDTAAGRRVLERARAADVGPVLHVALEGRQRLTDPALRTAVLERPCRPVLSDGGISPWVLSSADGCDVGRRTRDALLTPALDGRP